MERLASCQAAIATPGPYQHRLRRGEARRSSCALLRLHQRVVQQLRQLLEGRSLLVYLRRGRGSGSMWEADRLHRLQGETAHKDGEAPEQVLFACLQQIVAPGNR